MCVDLYEPRHEKTGFPTLRKQGSKSAVQLLHSAFVFDTRTVLRQRQNSGDATRFFIYISTVNLRECVKTFKILLQHARDKC